MKIKIDIEIPTQKGPLTPKQKWKLAWQLMRQKPEGRPPCDWTDDLIAFVNSDLLDLSYFRAADHAYFRRAMERFTGDYIFHLTAMRKKYGDAHVVAYETHHHDFLMSRLAVE
ncbi:MAG: hypothetical protein V7735_24250 [Photobacterium frigidiphilum]|uniref:hypothetical protein n=1 Tax=Photobacterium frigidiphilum TaxID=264736 RepID=UPI003002F250